MSCKNDIMSPEPGLVVMMCGIAGAGKTTFSQELERNGFVRISIDEVVWEVFGKFGIDYAESEYSSRLEKARAIVEERMILNLEKRQAIVLDSSFWSKSERERVKQIIAKHGGHHQIVYLKVPEDILRERLKLRSKRFDANAAFAITDDILKKFFHGFEEPSDEGEIIIETASTS